MCLPLERGFPDTSDVGRKICSTCTTGHSWKLDDVHWTRKQYTPAKHWYTCTEIVGPSSWKTVVGRTSDCSCIPCFCRPRRLHTVAPYSFNLCHLTYEQCYEGRLNVTACICDRVQGVLAYRQWLLIWIKCDCDGCISASDISGDAKGTFL
jgi:hypothetical protein